MVTGVNFSLNVVESISATQQSRPRSRPSDMITPKRGNSSSHSNNKRPAQEVEEELEDYAAEVVDIYEDNDEADEDALELEKKLE